jgi:hypothetical protein
LIATPKTADELMEAVLAWPPAQAKGITRDSITKWVEERGSDSVGADLVAIYGQMQTSVLDPYTHCWIPQHWLDAKKLLEDNDRVLISGGNRSGKSMFSSWWVMHMLAEKPESRIAVFSMTAQSSVRDQQPALWQFMPQMYKNLKRSQVENIRFTQKNGFTDNTFILPNGSQLWAMQYSQAPDSLEGSELDAVWFDELVPHHWVETAEYRLTTRRASRKTGKLLISATPITGWTPVVNDFVAGSKVIDTRPAPLLNNAMAVPGCRPGEMPYMADCLRPKSKVIWFHTEMNPWQDPDEFERTLGGESTINIRIRAYGYCEKSTGNWFPKFSNTHIIKHEDVPVEGTNYMCVDPAGSRNWAVLWLRVDSANRMYVYREWPDKDTYGEWAVAADKVEGAMGPAQKPEGRGIGEYKEMFLELEDGEEIEERLIDPRAGGTPAATREGGQTLIDLLGEESNEMWFVPAPGLTIEQGIGQINDVLNYNTDEPVSIVNEPRLLISERCGNLIDCMQNISSAGGEKNKFKDFTDVLRYMTTHEPIHVDEKTYAAVGGGSY